MAGNLHAVAIQWLTALVAVFFIIDPFAATPAFLAMTAGCDRLRRKQMARRASLTCVVILSVFATVGKYLFRVFGISLPAFKLAGGLLLLLVALDMLQARRSRTRETPEEQVDACAIEDVGIIPMGIPMLAGPGSISTVMVLVGQAPSWREAIPVLAAIVLTSAICYFVLASADRVEAILGEIGIRVLTRLMGLVLTAIAFQFFVSALVDMHVVAPVALP
ncbi:MAG TPA: MarC family protein [Bryobacteraceae bacterium]|jgi:multiple antibiotic resistance protein|nr:MarC family protein [Bryobacteraceae bacterium]